MKSDQTFVTPDLQIDIPAIRAAAKVRYAEKLGFINRYEGAPKRFWQWRQARRAIAGVWSEARAQRHDVVFDRLPASLPYTQSERARMAQLSITMSTCPVSMQGNSRYRAAAGEFAQIGRNVQARACQAIIDAARAA